MKTAAFRCPSCLSLASLLIALLAPPLAHAAAAPEPGLLFYVSGEKGTTADFSAGGTPEPNFDSEVTRVADGAKGAAFVFGTIEDPSELRLDYTSTILPPKKYFVPPEKPATS